MNLGLPNQALETTGFCACVVPLGFSLLMVYSPVSQLDRWTVYSNRDAMRHFDNRRVMYWLLVVVAVAALLLILQSSRREGRSPSMHVQWRSPGTWNFGWKQWVAFSPDGAVVGGERSLGLGPVMITYSRLTSTPPHFVQPNGAANGSQPIRSETNSTSAAAGSGR